MSSFVSGRSAVLVTGVVFLLAGLGCSGGPVIPPTVSVSGKVIYKDQPLADAEVSFASKLDNKDIKPARGKTNASGEFTLSTYIDPQHEVSGATPGDFSVTVTKNETMDHAEMMKKFKENPAMEFKPMIPAKYAAMSSTPLSANVKADGENKFEFKLED